MNQEIDIDSGVEDDNKSSVKLSNMKSTNNVDVPKRLHAK